MTKLSFPSAYDDLKYKLVAINAALISIAAGALRAYENSDAWLTSVDYALGYTALAKLQIDLANMTFILPAIQGGTGVDALPVFSVHKNGTNQTGITHNAFTKVTWPTEEIDSGGYFAGDRFTPQVAGTYLITFSFFLNATADQAFIGAVIYKNGVAYRESLPRTRGTGSQGTAITALVPMNGSSDYVEAYAYQTSGATQVIAGSSLVTFFQGAWIAPQVDP